jgi:hypothetical protein
MKYVVQREPDMSEEHTTSILELKSKLSKKPAESCSKLRELTTNCCWL